MSFAKPVASWIVFVSVESHDIMEVGQPGNKKSDSIKTIFPFLEVATLLVSQLNFPDFLRIFHGGTLISIKYWTTGQLF